MAMLVRAVTLASGLTSSEWVVYPRKSALVVPKFVLGRGKLEVVFIGRRPKRARMLST